MRLRWRGRLWHHRGCLLRAWEGCAWTALTSVDNHAHAARTGFCRFEQYTLVQFLPQAGKSKKRPRGKMAGGSRSTALVSGTSFSLEKSYFRLTSAPNPADVRPPKVLRVSAGRRGSGGGLWLW